MVSSGKVGDIEDLTSQQRKSDQKVCQGGGGRWDVCVCFIHIEVIFDLQHNLEGNYMEDM